MAIQASGQIDISDLAAEFGGSGELRLSDYYRGAGLVPDSPSNSGVPTSGEIKLSDFYSAVNILVTVSGQTTTDNNSSPASSSITFNSTGTVFESTTLGGSVQVDSSTDWIMPNGAAPSDYQIKADLVSGTTPTGPSMGSWVALSTNRAWTITRVGAGSDTGTITISIRKGAGATLDSANYTLTANAF